MSKNSADRPWLQDIDTRILNSLGSLTSDPNGFVLLEGMTRLEDPRSLTELAHQFGASPADVAETIGRLVFLGFVTPTGKAYTATRGAIAAMAFLRDLFEHEEVEFQMPAGVSETLDFTSVMEVGEFALAATATNNGMWSSSQLVGGELGPSGKQLPPSSTSVAATLEDLSEPKLHGPPVYDNL
jgi:hypothetical protein